MSAVDIILIVVIVAAAAAAIVFRVRAVKHGKGCCGDCSRCSQRKKD